MQFTIYPDGTLAGQAIVADFSFTPPSAPLGRSSQEGLVQPYAHGIATAPDVDWERQAKLEYAVRTVRATAAAAAGGPISAGTLTTIEAKRPQDDKAEAEQQQSRKKRRRTKRSHRKDAHSSVSARSAQLPKPCTIKHLP